MAYNKKAVDKYIESLTEAFSYVSPKLDAYEEVEEIEEWQDVNIVYDDVVIATVELWTQITKEMLNNWIQMGINDWYLEEWTTI